VGVTARDERAKDAGAKVASTLNAVRDALVLLGLDRSSLPSAGYTVSTDNNGRQSKGHTARSSLAIELVNMDLLGAVLDAALGAGATDVLQISLLPEQADDARAKALELAFSQARRDAGVLARASGRGLGGLLLMSTDRLSTDRAGYSASSEYMTVVGAGTEIPAPEVAISATVRAEWALEPGAR
jgi:uncharacterized protein YggE